MRYSVSDDGGYISRGNGSWSDAPQPRRANDRWPSGSAVASQAKEYQAGSWTDMETSTAASSWEEAAKESSSSSSCWRGWSRGIDSASGGGDFFCESGSRACSSTAWPAIQEAGDWQTSGEAKANAVVVDPLGEAKARLVERRGGLCDAAIEALRRSLKAKYCLQPDAKLLAVDGLDEELFEDLRYVLENDRWAVGSKFSTNTGTRWIQDWLKDGSYWLDERTVPAGKSAEWCQVCEKDFLAVGGFEAHSWDKDHQKRQRLWTWRHGCEPPRGPGPQLFAGSGPRGAVDVEFQATDRGRLLLQREAEREKSRWRGKPLSAADEVELAIAKADTPEGRAKRRLVEYRDGLPQEARSDIVCKIRRVGGVRRVNDITGAEVLEGIFPEEICAAMADVHDLDWLFKEPTFSWISGLYWHEKATTLEQAGPRHSNFFCHICEVDSGDEASYKVHLEARRHAASLTRWVEKMGASRLPTQCDRCPDATVSGGLEPGDARPDPWSTHEPYKDIDFERPEGLPYELAPEEDQPVPKGFESVASSETFAMALPYVAFVVRSQDAYGVGRWNENCYKKQKRGDMYKVHAATKEVEIGPLDKKTQQFCIDLQAPSKWADNPSWRSLAIPLSGSAVWEGAYIDFSILVQYREGGEMEEVGRVSVRVPVAGVVEEVSMDLSSGHQSDYDNCDNGCGWGRGSDGWQESSGSNGWQSSARSSAYRGGDDKEEMIVGERRQVPLLEFVGLGQVEAAGGIYALRGSQRAFQLATEEVMLSFLMYVPSVEAPAPLLLFLHGDMTRDPNCCKMPGLADFSEEYGPAEVLKGDKKPSHPVRSFVVVTPTCPTEYWWFRSPAEHDATGYAVAVERWFNELIDWTMDLGLTPPESDNGPQVRLAGQSMGGYACLELARAMPQRIAAVAASAPCFDACRLDHLAARLVDVPLWVLIGRQDSMCSYEESASLVLKMRAKRAKCVRLSSNGIKGHNEACLKLDKPWLYAWLKDPVKGRATDSWESW